MADLVGLPLQYGPALGDRRPLGAAPIPTPTPTAILTATATNDRNGIPVVTHSYGVHL